jgi:A/G-specific adenine glycosylase
MSQSAQSLVKWYRQNRRQLPWRSDANPYRIWISEVMLQQTTVTAVIPFYERFLSRFPTVHDLAKASVGEVLEYWAGLGYYSRARNLHKAAQHLSANGFPKTHQELMELPGFGPYTSRAVASLSFNERVGVLDGNVIRVLSRSLGLKIQWWKPEGRNKLQLLSDQLVENENPSDVNQGLMELGATICTPQSPACLLCPWSQSCVARNEDKIAKLPLAKPKRDREIWIWQPVVHRRGQKVAVLENNYAPFLKGHLLWPGKVKKAAIPPKKFSFKGTVTHHDIYVVVDAKQAKAKSAQLRWLDTSNLKREIPSSLIRKVLDYV